MTGRHQAVAASTAVRDLLTGPARPGTVSIARSAAVHVLLDGHVGAARVLSLITSDAAASPLGIRLPVPSSADPLAQLSPGTPVLVGSGRVRTAALELLVTRWWDPGVRRRIPEGSTAHPRSLASLVALLPPPPAELATLDDRARPAELIGLGPGLTPAGDDRVAGALAAAHAFGEPDEVAALVEDVHALGHRTTPLSAALLRCAADGDAFREVRALLAALAQGDDPGPALTALLGVGATSGAELARGVGTWLTAGADMTEAVGTSGEPE